MVACDICSLLVFLHVAPIPEEEELKLNFPLWSCSPSPAFSEFSQTPICFSQSKGLWGELWAHIPLCTPALEPFSLVRHHYSAFFLERALALRCVASKNHLGDLLKCRFRGRHPEDSASVDLGFD